MRTDVTCGLTSCVQKAPKYFSSFAWNFDHGFLFGKPKNRIGFPLIKYFNENPDEYFKGVELYKDINDSTGKVPIEYFTTAIKMLKEKGEQNVTTIRRITDPRLLSSRNVKPLLKSLIKFNLITIEKRGNNIMIVPTDKLIKTPLNKLI
jgi:hypothetical protein